MSLSTAILLVCAAYVCAACLYLTLHPRYVSGVLGYFGLGLTSLGALARVSSLAEDCWYGVGRCDVNYFAPEMFLWLGLAMFFAGSCLLLRKVVKREGGSLWPALPWWRRRHMGDQDESSSGETSQRNDEGSSGSSWSARKWRRPRSQPKGD